MPARVAFLVVAIVVAFLSALAILGAALWPWSSLAAVLAAVLGLAFGVWLVFVYYPKFDPTGLTLWQGPGDAPIVALTFDDGPSEHTAAVLDVLERAHVRATFFFLGANAARYPALVERARAAGHAIGNHGFSHAKLHFASRRQVEEEIERGAQAIGELALGGGKKLLRTPHGFKSLTVASVARARGYRLIGWTAGVWDSDCPGVEAIVARARAALRAGCILLLHDGAGTSADDRSQTVAALAAIIDHCREKGYRLVTVPELCS